MSQSYTWPSSSASANPSVGSNGSASPTSATLVAGQNPSVNLQPLQTDASGNLKTVLVAGTAIIGTVKIDQTTPGTTNGVVVNNTVPISAASLPLPAGASTSALQTTISGQLPATLGAKTIANSLAVNIASDQIIPTTASATDVTATGSITIVNSNPSSGAATAGSTVLINPAAGLGLCTIQVTGVYTGALTAQVTVDGTNWVALAFVQNVTTGALSATITSATVGVFQAQMAGATQFRISANVAVTGTAVVTIRATARDGLIGLDAPLPAGANIIGALSANQSSNIAQINAVTPLMGNGVTGTGSLRVTIASDTTTNTNPFLVKGQTGTLTDGSGSTSATPSTSTQIFATNAARKYLLIQNLSPSVTIYINFTSAATASTGSLAILPFGSYVEEQGYISTEAINVLAASASIPFTAKQG